MFHARLSISRDDIVAPVSPRLLGSLVDNMGTVRPRALTDVTVADGTTATAVLPGLSWSIVRFAARNAA